MAAFTDLLLRNRNYRYTWLGQVVSELGDHFNNIAVLSLVFSHKGEGSGLIVMGVMMARALPAMLAGPFAGVLLDRMDRRLIMIASDIIRGIVAALFIFTIGRPGSWLLYLLSALLMGASPFFTAGRASILPRITTHEELHTANSLTQITQWTTQVVGASLAGFIIARSGFTWAFIFNALSFVFSAWAISKLHVPGGHFRAERKALTEAEVVQPLRDYREGLAYLAATPLFLGVALLNIGWATGGGTAQILLGLFGDVVFGWGPEGNGLMWASSGVGLIVGGMLAHRLIPRLTFGRYKWMVSICYVVHGAGYILFALAPNIAVGMLFLAVSRAAGGMTSVLNFNQMLRHVSDSYRGRVYSTIESLTWCAMMLSMMATGIALEKQVSPRTIGVVGGVCASMTAIFWAWANLAGRLTEPALEGVDPDDVEVHAEIRA